MQQLKCFAGGLLWFCAQWEVGFTENRTWMLIKYSGTLNNSTGVPRWCCTLSHVKRFGLVEWLPLLSPKCGGHEFLVAVSVSSQFLWFPMTSPVDSAIEMETLLLGFSQLAFLMRKLRVNQKKGRGQCFLDPSPFKSLTFTEVLSC